MTTKFKYLACLLCLLAIPLFASEDIPVRATLHVDHSSLQPGKSTWAAVELQVDPSWHVYWKNPGDTGVAPSIQWDLPTGITASDIYWPYPETESTPIGISHFYQDKVQLLVKLNAAKDFQPQTLSIKGTVDWLACSEEQCLPGESTIAASVAVSQEVPSKAHDSLIENALKHLPKSGKELKVNQNSREIDITVPGKFDETALISFSPNEQDIIEETISPEIVKDSSGKLHVKFKKVNPDDVGGVLVFKHLGKIDAWEVTPFNSGSLETNQFAGGVFWAIILAFVGGLILNLMPCVLPVISVKIFSFIKMAKESRWKIFQHGLAFSMGVLISFWILAGLLLLLQAYGHAVGWGFQLQEPIFVAILAAVILVFGLSLFGLFEMGMGVAGAAGKAHHQSSKKSNELLGSFLSGILATTVATPCTGPFLGSAVGFAVTLPPISALMIFTSLGLGMASPYLFVAAFPPLLKIFPKPGKWMITFKEIMGFMMILTTLWLLWVFSAQAGTLALFVLMFGLFLLSIGCWVFGKWGSPAKSKGIRYVGYAFAAAFLGMGVYTIIISASLQEPAVGAGTELVAMADVKDQGDRRWEVFNQERFDYLRAQGIPVFIDFTARWCLICQANHAVLSASDVEEKFSQLGVIKMKADWTRRDPAITEALRKHGRNSVPLYLLYGSDDSEPYVMPQMLTPDVVLDYLGRLNKNG